MSKPVIFTVSAAWDDEASVWTGHCDDIPAAADAPTLDELLKKISAIAIDLLPDNHPGADPASVFVHSARSAKPHLPWPDGAAVRPPAAGTAPRRRLHHVRQGKGSHEIWHSPITRRNFAVPIGIPSRHTANAILRQAGLPKAF